jgi:cell pole-organizing protein PopZ
MKTLKPSLAPDEIVTKSGRKFRPYYKDLLDNMPPDLVKELARRELEKIRKAEKTK